MATSDGLDGCLQRGRSQSDPNILTEPGIDLAHGTGKTDVSLSGCLCSKCASVLFFLCCRFFGDAVISKRHPCFLCGISEHQGIVSAYGSMLGGKIQTVTPNIGPSY